MALEEEEILDEGEGEELNFVAIAVAAVVILGLIGGAVWFFVLREPPPDKKKDELPKWEAPEDLGREYVTDLLPELVINPRDSNGRYFLIVKLDIALNDQAVLKKEVFGKKWRMAEVKNIVIDIFSEYTVDELRTPKFKDEARRRIVEQLNALAGWTQEDALVMDEDGEIKKPPVQDVYFMRYILQ